MRIIGGLAAGRILKVPKGFDVRPTPDLVRQAVFNSLGERVAGTRVLDLFSGTAALGLECLSRGATQVFSIEKSATHARFIRDNLLQSGLPVHAHELRVGDVFTLLAQLAATDRQFDLVVADPPYGEKNVGRRSTSLAQRLLDDADLPRLVTPGGWLVLGHTKRDTLSLPTTWEETRVLKHGDSVMRLLRLNATPAAPEPTPVG